MIGDFHFLRPWFLLVLLPLSFLLWLIYNQHDAQRAWRGVVAPHLLPHLLSGQAQQMFSPLIFVGIGGFLAIIAAAGPSWLREPAPFADDVASMVIVVKVTPSMLNDDVQPSRLARGVQKVHDLLAERGKAKTSLIAYARTAHRVMPLTTDAGIINTFAQALDPQIMPGDGDAAADALRLADRALPDGGSIVWITDGVAPEQSAALAAWRKNSSTPVRLLAPLADGAELKSLTTNASMVNARVVRMTADEADVAMIASESRTSSTVSSQHTERWQDEGFWLTPAVAVLVLAFFRRGFMIR